MNFLELNFVGDKRLFALVYTNQDAASRRFKAKGYYLPKGIIDNYNVIINGKYFYDQPIDSDILQYEEIRKLTTGQGAQPANINRQDVPRTFPSKVLRTSPKDSVWPSRGHPDMTSTGRPNLMFKRRRWEVDLGRPQDVLRSSPRGPSEHSNLDVPKFLLNFLSDLIRLTKSISKHFSTQGVLRTQSNFQAGAFSEKLVNDFLVVNYFRERTSS